MKAKKINISDLSIDKKTPAPQPSTNNVQPGLTPPPISRSSKLPAPLLKLKTKWDKLSHKQQYAIIGVVAAIILFIPLFFIYKIFTDLPERPATILNLKGNYITPAKQSDNLDTLATYTLQDPSIPRTEESPINGKLLTKEELANLKKRLPVAVMINNHYVARPQSNLTQADIVYETLVESGITRYMAVYWSNDVKKVGPIRSARQQYLEWLSPFDAIYLHDGYASGDDPRINAGGNMYLYGTKTLATFGAWREFDGVRFAPHNEYTSILTAWDEAKNRGWGGLPANFESWEFKPEAVTEQRGSKTEASIKFHTRLTNSGMYDAKWIYNKASNSYLREIGGTPDIDQEKNQQVAAKVVIIQTTNTIPTYNEKGHVIVETIGTGKASILQDGKVIEGSWKKDSRLDRTSFFDSENKPVEFNRGLIWISVVSQSDSQFDIIDQ